jgi:hypothetical protein
MEALLVMDITIHFIEKKKKNLKDAIVLLLATVSVVSTGRW